MINQRLYPDIILGNGTVAQTIAVVGCYECALLQGLLDRGYDFSVGQFDALLTDRQCFVDNVLISASKLPVGIPEIFLEGRTEAWTDMAVEKYIADPQYIVLGEVSAKGIGGSGQHFVYMQAVDMSGSKITMTYIGDPWGGLDRQKVTTRYNAFGNILSLRVFKIIVKEPTMANMYHGQDLSNVEAMKICVDDHNAIQNKEYVPVPEVEAGLKVAYNNGYGIGFTDGQKKQPAATVEIDAAMWDADGMSIKTNEGGIEKTINYRRKS